MIHMGVPMIHRATYVARIIKGYGKDAEEYFKGKEEEIGKNNDIISCNVYHSFDIIIIYLESAAGIGVAELFEAPGFLGEMGICGERFVPMENIFHYNRPESVVHWKRKKESIPSGFIGRIKPGMLSSYVYYHYILQETTDRERDKYGAIFMFQNYLFFYRDMCGETEYPSYKGVVNGKIPENWRELMRVHFEAWRDIDNIWKPMRKII